MSPGLNSRHFFRPYLLLLRGGGGGLVQRRTQLGNDFLALLQLQQQVPLLLLRFSPQRSVRVAKPRQVFRRTGFCGSGLGLKG